MSTLHDVVSREHLSAVQSLVKAGIDVNVRDRFMRNALHICLENNNPNPKIVALLIDAGINTKNIMFHYCSNKGKLNPTIMKLLVDAGEDVSLGMHLTISKTDITLTNWFLDNGADPTSLYFDYIHRNPVIDEVIDPASPIPRNLLCKIMARSRYVETQKKINFIQILIERLGENWFVEQSRYIHQDNKTALDYCSEEVVMNFLMATLTAIDLRNGIERIKKELPPSTTAHSRRKLDIL